jgi:hypothetical protein
MEVNTHVAEMEVNTHVAEKKKSNTKKEVQQPNRQAARTCAPVRIPSE